VINIAVLQAPEACALQALFLVNFMFNRFCVYLQAQSQKLMSVVMHGVITLKL